MAAEAPRSSSSADSYIGSLISLTSKSEIRYEGVLYNINTDESSIGLRNVRSFGTEGRKKDGPQVPGSDKIYEYILFRGSDIKDLQVKSSPPSVQTMPSINNDPAIIQSHYPRPVSTSTSLSADASGSLTDPSSHNPQVAGPGPNFQGGLPLYQPAGNVGSWGPSPPPPNANGSSLAMPVYWQGFYGPPNGLPHMHQQSLLRPPPGLSMPPPMQQPMQYPGFNATVQPGGTNLPGSNIAEFPPGLLPSNTSSLNLISTSLSLSPLPTTMPPVPSATLASELLPSLTPNKAPSSAFSASTLGVSLPSLTPLTTSTSDVSAFKPPISSNSNAVSAPSVPFQNTISAPSLPFQAISQSISPIVGTSSSSLVENSAPSLVTPGQLLQSGPTKSRSTVIPSPKSPQVAHKDVEVVQVSSSLLAEPSVAVSREAQPPILPLPVPARALPKLNGAAFQHRPSYRGRERGRGPGSSRPVTTFTEDFDFTAMNEKFKKDEVWGHLGKSNKPNSRDKEEDGNLSDEEEYQDEDDTEVPKVEVKPLYNKDDFFDSLSSNALDRESHVGRTRFSEQMKIDTETFGDFPRNRGGRGGRGPNRGGRGSYYGGRGYGYSYGYAGRGRGRGWGMSGRAP